MSAPTIPRATGSTALLSRWPGRGRLASTLSVGLVVGALVSLSLLAIPVSTVLTGVLLQAAGPAPTFVIIALGCLLGTAHIALTPGVRHIENTDIQEGQR